MREQLELKERLMGERTKVIGDGKKHCNRTT